MRIVVKEGGEDILRRVCPVGDPRAAFCRHCDPEKAPCMGSEAAYECVKGVVCLEGGTKEEASLCPYGALVWDEGSLSLRKCDLCATGHGYPLCFLEDHNSIDIHLEKGELSEIGERVGWFVYGPSEFMVDFLPILPWEARLVEEVLSIFEKTKGEYDVKEIVEEVSEEKEVPRFTRKRVLEIIRITLSPLGPLQMIDEPEVEEIAVVGLKRPVKVFVRGKGWLDTNLFIWTESYFVNLVNTAAEELGRRLTLRTPRVNAVLSDGSRLHAVMPPLSNVHSLTVRRFSAAPLTPSHLLDLGLMGPEQMAVLWLAMERELNIMIAGNTGSGKTTLLNALFGFVPLDERVVTVEEVPEVRLPHPHFIRMIPRGDVGMMDLIRDTLRMRPDRVIVGEVRREEEARAYMETVLAGQGRGSYTTIHGRSVGEVGARLLSMGISEVDLPSVDVVVVLRRWGRGGNVERRLVEMGTFREDGIEAALAAEEEEIAERARFLEENKVFDLEEFARRYGEWR